MILKILSKYRILKAMLITLEKDSETFEDDIDKFCEDNNISLSDEDIENAPKNEETSISISEDMKKFMSRKFKIISKITHPDKIENNILNKYYVEASRAYKDDNIFEIFDICDILKEEFDHEFCEEDIQEMMSYLDSSIDNVKNRNQWEWSSKTKQQKAKVIVGVLRLIGAV